MAQVKDLQAGDMFAGLKVLSNTYKDNVYKLKLLGSLTEINENTFDKNETATSIKLVNNVETIKENAFKNCASLKEVSIPASTTSISKTAFATTSNINLINNSKLELVKTEYQGVSKIEKVEAPSTEAPSTETPSTQVVISTLNFINPKTEYSIGDNFEYPKVLVTYSNGYQKTITDSKTGGTWKNVTYTWIGTNMSKGNYVLTFYYHENATELSINLNISVSEENISVLGTPPDDEIWYTTTNNKKIQLVLTANLYTVISNKIDENGNGIIKFSEPLTILENGLFMGANGSEATNNKYLTSIILPNSITELHNSTFYFCENLKTIKLSNSLISIGTECFQSCKKLENFELPNTLKYISRSAFEDCENITSINIPDSVISIANLAFGGCRKLTNITIGSGLTTLNSIVYACTALTTITIPSTITAIDDLAFLYCNNLTKIYYSGIATGFPWSAENATLISDK